ncbi:Protein of unknown function [Gryllus bimaculatus]|nr:Protein of unknown function [Gryllus bimaculatus]
MMSIYYKIKNWLLD